MSQDSTATRGYCPTHDRHYGKLEQCSVCRATANVAGKQGSPKADMRELELREGEYREADKYLRRLAREWLDNGTAQERGVALKAFDMASKYARLALDVHMSIKEFQHDTWLVEQDRIRRGGN